MSLPDSVYNVGWTVSYVSSRQYRHCLAESVDTVRLRHTYLSVISFKESLVVNTYYHFNSNALLRARLRVLPRKHSQ